MHRLGVAVLRVLNQEDHQESDNRGACIDDQLPGIGKMKNRTGGRPHGDYQNCGGKRPRASKNGGRTASENTKGVADHAKKVALLFVFF